MKKPPVKAIAAYHMIEKAKELLSGEPHSATGSASFVPTWPLREVVKGIVHDSEGRVVKLLLDDGTQITAEYDRENLKPFIQMKPNDQGQP